MNASDDGVTVIAPGTVWREIATGESHYVRNVKRRGEEIHYVIGTQDWQKLAAPRVLSRATFLATHERVNGGDGATG